MQTPFLGSQLPSLLQVVRPLFSGMAILMALLSGAFVFLGKIREGLTGLLTSLFLWICVGLLGGLLETPVETPVLPAAPNPLSLFVEHARSLGEIAVGLIGTALLMWCAVRLYQKRRVRQQREQERTRELTLRSEYEAWLDDETLKLEIEALSASAHSGVWPLLTRLRQCRADNLHCRFSSIVLKEIRGPGSLYKSKPALKLPFSGGIAANFIVYGQFKSLIASRKKANRFAFSITDTDNPTKALKYVLGGNGAESQIIPLERLVIVKNAPHYSGGF